MNGQRNESNGASARLRGLQLVLSKQVIDALIGHQLQTRFCKRVHNIDLVWLIVGFGLFSNKSYRSIFRYCHAPNVPVPIRATLTTARKRLSADLLKKLYQGVVTLLAKSVSRTPSAFYHGMRLMAIDGTLLDCPDADANRQEFGRVENQTSHGAFPKVRVVSLCEGASRVLWRSAIGTYHQSEQKLVLPLLEHLSPKMLLLADRHFGIAPIIYPLIRQKASFLIRVKKSQYFSVETRLIDGSFLSTIYNHRNDRRSHRPGKPVRVIRYQHVDRNRPHRGEIHVLITNLLDPLKFPALELIDLYHKRWEEEIAFSEWKVLMCQGRVQRSQSPEMVRQEIWGMLIIRKLIFEAAEMKKVAPSEISFTGAFEILHARLPEVPSGKRVPKQWYKDLLNEIAQEQLPPRANRINPRKLKKRSKAWPTKRDRDRRPPKPQGKFADCVRISI